ncbi:MAG: hypothetical protein ABIF40_02955 [archaeon]
MASVLDLGLLNYLSPVFVFLLIFAATFAVLQKTKVFGGKSGLDSIISFALAMMFILSGDFVALITKATPMFMLFIVFIVFLVLIFLFVGVEENLIAKAFSDKLTIWIILIVLFLMFGYAITQVYGEQIHQITSGESNEESGVMQSVGDTLFHPRVLGFVFLLIVSAQAVRMIAGKVS